MVLQNAYDRYSHTLDVFCPLYKKLLFFGIFTIILCSLSIHKLYLNFLAMPHNFIQSKRNLTGVGISVRIYIDHSDESIFQQNIRPIKADTGTFLT